ncbi:MAG: PH domain-containing protein [Actinomycetota bacterium]|nr:PH domain-containing protein [Actinomycetota bacterium]
MASHPVSTQALRTLRQRGSIALGAIAMLCGFGLALWSLAGGEPSLVFIGIMLLVGSGGWVFFVRPALVISMHGVHVHNPLRRTVVPWAQVVDVGTRWNLEIYHGERRTAAWAIASHVERPRGSGLLSIVNGRLGGADSGPPPPKGVTVQSAAQSVELARQEWTEMVVDRRPEVSAEGEVERSWDWVDVAALGVPLLVVVASLLG